MGILKKKCGRPRKDGAAPQNMSENEENNASAQELSIDKLCESLIGKYITFAKGDFHSEFLIAEVAKVYGNVEVREKIGNEDGDVLMLSMECASELIRCGYFLTDVSSFVLTVSEPGMARKKETEECPDGNLQESQAMAKQDEAVLEKEAEPARTVKGWAIVLHGVGEVENAFLGMMHDLEDHGCAPMLVHRASKAADRLYEALNEMEKWYREKEGLL